MFVTPEVYLIGYTSIDWSGLRAYLEASGNEDFLETARAAKASGLSDGEVLCSFYAKLCYSALTVGRNDNISRVRDVPDNLRNCYDCGHGSVFRHATINFVARNVSRVFTHELVRHGAGTAFSQTSGRYVRRKDFDLVSDRVLEPVREDIENLCNRIVAAYNIMAQKLRVDEEKDKGRQKALTSALRRILPNGIANEIGFTVNLNAIRHITMMRTSRYAEREIRDVFGKVYTLTKSRFPLLYHGAKEEVVDGLVEVSGMRTQPYG